MKTKLITLLLAIVASVGTTYAYSYSIEVDGIWYEYDVTNNKAVVTYAGSDRGSSTPYYNRGEDYDNIKYRGSIYIPSSIEYEGSTINVTGIGDHAFYLCDELTSVYLPNTITHIDESAFESCGITSITIPDSVTSIGGKAFSKSGLQSATIGDGVKSIDKEAFGDCYHLTSLVIGNGVTSIGDFAFVSCRSLTSVTIPSSVTSIGKDAFEFSGLTSVVWNPKRCSITSDLSMNSYNPFDLGIDSLTSFTFGEEVEVIPGFLCCRLPITSITIPNSVDSIGENAFAGCVGLSSVTIPDNVKSIEYRAFSGCSGLISVTIGNGLGSIEGSIFEGCTSLNSVTIGNNVKSIGNRAFSGCTSLTSIIIPNSVIRLEGEVFTGCESLNSVTIGNGLRDLGGRTFIGCTNLKSIDIPENVTFMGDKTFYGSGLKHITIPVNVDSVGERAFADCDSLTSVTWNAKEVVAYGEYYYYQGKFFENSPVRKIIIGEQVDSLPDFGMDRIDTLVWNAINYSKMPRGTFGDLTVSPLYNAYNIENVRFGTKVESIPPYLCYRSRIKSVNIPDNVKSIGENAFSECDKLTRVIIGNGVTTIGGGAFNECNINSLIIGSGVTTIEEGAFYENWDLNSLTCYAATPPAYNSPFADWKTLNIYVPSGSVNAYKAADGWKEHNILPIGATPTTTTGIKINPSDYSVNITWVSVSGATTYELVVKDKNGNVVCKVTFDSDGLLTSIVFHAPSRNGAPQQTQETGFTYTLMGLNSGTEYDVTITAKNAGGSTIDEQTMSFTTQGEYTGEEQGIEDILIDTTRSTKFLRDGQILIKRGDKIYTTTGQQVK